MKLYVVRHGVTKDNKLGIINGPTDDSLEPEGVEQARLTAKLLPTNLKKIYSSDLKRAKETAEIINEDLGLEIQYFEVLREVMFGSLTGRSWKDIEAEKGKGFRNSYLNLEYDFRSLGGESFDDVKNRLTTFFSELKLRHENDNLLISSHGGILRHMYFIYKNEYNKVIKNASVHEFEI